MKNHFRNIILDRWSQIDPSKPDNTASEFARIYTDNLKLTDTEKQAYDKTEATWLAIFGRNKYRGFNSFRCTFNNKQKYRQRSSRYCKLNEWDSKFNFLI